MDAAVPDATAPGGLGARVSLSLALATFSQAMKRRKEATLRAVGGVGCLDARCSALCSHWISLLRLWE